jgi:SNF2 family DNA or RNA helicase
MDSLTEEQRRRIERNRLAALEKSRERRNKTVEKENQLAAAAAASSSVTIASCSSRNDFSGQSSGTSVSASISNVNNAADASSKRESFGDSGIDWNAAVNLMDRVVTQRTQQTQHPTNNDAAAAAASDLKSSSTGIIANEADNRKRKIHDSTTTHPQHLQQKQQSSHNNLTDEQRIRMENNRRRALEKKQQLQLQKQNQSHHSTAASSLQTQTNTAQPLKQSDSISCSPQKPPALTEEQKKRMEENRLKALQKKHSSSPSKASAVADKTNDDMLLATKPPPASTTKKSGLPPLYPELQYDHSRILPINDEETDLLIENADLDKELLNGWTLYDHQKEGVIRALRMRRLILAFDMGLGKTIIGCVWSKAFLRTFEGIKIIIIAPVSLHDDWQRTATNATGLKPDTGTKKKKAAKKKPAATTSDEYYATGKKRKSKKKEEEEEDKDDDDNPNVYIYSWNNVSAYKEVINDCPEGYVVICDEAHSMQSMSSQRTKDALKLMFPKYCHGVLLLSGTPMKNGRPSNLFPLLRAVRHPFGDCQERYERNFCDGHLVDMGNKQVWIATGSNNLRELNAHTASHIFRLTKEECMSKELPPRKREFKTVPVCPLQQQRYNIALKDLARAYTSSQGDIGGSRDSEDILTPFNKLRQISSFAKVDVAVSMANTILAEESSIVIFTSFVEVAKQIHRKLEDMDWAGELLTGETVAKKRQAMVDNFQSGLSPAFVCTYGAGGVGLTLTAACTVILVDRPWTPGDVNQAEDRVRRIGQKRRVRSIWIRAFHIDEQIDNLIDHKEVTSNTAVDGKASNATGHGRSAPKVKISELIKTVLDI